MERNRESVVAFCKMDYSEVAAILADESKRVVGDLEWVEPQPGSKWVKFSARVENAEGWPLKVWGSYNRVSQGISICLTHPAIRGRMYGLELGSGHQYPDGSRLEGTHKHRLAEIYIPDDITAQPGEAVKAWREFCAEAAITHEGDLAEPPGIQETLW